MKRKLYNSFYTIKHSSSIWKSCSLIYEVGNVLWDKYWDKYLE